MPKDACYQKVKRRYKVFPSAYASRAIAKCRKVGAANWGNKSRKKPKAELQKISHNHDILKAVLTKVETVVGDKNGSGRSADYGR